MEAATKRQRWALWCLTKKDYRDVEISKEEASKLIGELSAAKKEEKPATAKPTAKKATKLSIKKELEQYILEKFDSEIMLHCSEELKYESPLTLEANGKARHYTFVGGGCGIAYPKYRKNSKICKEIDKAAHDFRLKGAMKAFLKRFDKKTIKHYEDIGFPLSALWFQSLRCQNAYWYCVKDFATNVKGQKFDIISYLD